MVHFRFEAKRTATSWRHVALERRTTCRDGRWDQADKIALPFRQRYFELIELIDAVAGHCPNRIEPSVNKRKPMMLKLMSRSRSHGERRLASAA